MHGLLRPCFRKYYRKPWATCGGDPEHSSGSISSLFVTSDITDDVGDILIAFFLVGNEGGIVVVIAFERYLKSGSGRAFAKKHF
jgi:hypothetical protein